MVDDALDQVCAVAVADEELMLRTVALLRL